MFRWIRKRLLVNPCSTDSVVGDWMEKYFPTECWCCSALRGVLYGVLIDIVLAALTVAIVRLI